MIELSLKSPSNYEQLHARRMAEDSVASEREFEETIKQLPVMRKAKKKGSKK